MGGWREALIGRAPAFTSIDAGALDQSLSTAWAHIEEAWSGRLHVSSNVFLSVIEGWIEPNANAPQAIDALVAADAYLARACLDGDPAALRVLADTELARIGSWVSKIDSSDAFVDDVTQELSRKMLVGSGPPDDEPPKLAQYNGQRPLGAWLRVAAVRTAQDLRRRRLARGDMAYAKPLDDDHDIAAAEAKGDDPEVRLLKERYSREFADAFRATLETLDADDRSLLRLHYVDGLTLEEVARAYRVSRATAARSLAKARAAILEETRRRLRASLGESIGSPASLLALVESQLDISVARHLR